MELSEITKKHLEAVYRARGFEVEFKKDKVVLTKDGEVIETLNELFESCPEVIPE